MKLFAFSLRPYDELGYLEEFAKQEGFGFGWTAEYPSMENLDLAQGADAVSIITNPMTPEILDRFHEMGVRAIATRSIGYDHIDLEAAKRLGIRVAHAAYPPEGVANYAIMLMMMAARKVKFIMREDTVQDFTLTGKIGLDISSATVGIIGTGRIGATVAKHLSSFGCRILADDPYPREDVKAWATYVDRDTLLAESDIITLHAPGLEENRHMIGREAFRKMKDGAILVNAARGMLVDTDALIENIESGHVGAAALDTIENEADLYYRDRSRDILPHRDKAILSTFPNVIVTPHMAFYTREDVKNMISSSVGALVAFSRGEKTPYEVL